MQGNYHMIHHKIVLIESIVAHVPIQLYIYSNLQRL